MVNDVHGVQDHVENEMLHLKESQICLNLQPPVWSVVHSDVMCKWLLSDRITCKWHEAATV